MKWTPQGGEFFEKYVDEADESKIYGMVAKRGDKTAEYWTAYCPVDRPFAVKKNRDDAKRLVEIEAHK